MIPDALSFAQQGILRALGKHKLTVVVNTLTYLFVTCPIAFCLIFYFDFNINGLWYGMLTGFTVKYVSYRIYTWSIIDWEEVALEA
jgi:Na+-driven multidrug efflux pump